MSSRSRGRVRELVASVDRASARAEKLRRAFVPGATHAEVVLGVRTCADSVMRHVRRMETCHRALGYDYEHGGPFDIDDLDDDLALDVQMAQERTSDICAAVSGDIESVRDVDLEMGQDLVYELRMALRHARAVAGVMQREVAWSGRLRRSSTALEVWSARKLLGIAARLVQVDHRARYSEEFRGELRELAEADAGRTRQIGYAISQLVRAPALRVELRSARRRSASP